MGADNKNEFTDILTAFRTADDALNGSSDSLISTKWYEKLRRRTCGFGHKVKSAY
jgi:hypothetical protein